MAARAKKTEFGSNWLERAREYTKLQNGGPVFVSKCFSKDEKKK